MLNFRQKLGSRGGGDERDLKRIALQLSEVAQGKAKTVNQQVQFIDQTAT
jgi:hypothetical protein